MTYIPPIRPSVVDPRRLGGAWEDNVNHPMNKRLLWTGRLLHIDSETMVCTVAFDTGFENIRHDVRLPAPAGSGPRSWSGNIPERGTRVIVGFRSQGVGSYFPVIVDYMTSGIYHSRDFEPFSTIPPEDLERLRRENPEYMKDPSIFSEVVRLKFRKLYEGEFLASSSEGAEMLLDRDVLLTNRAGQEIRIRDSDQTITVNTLNEFTANAAGYYYRGMIKRSALSFYKDALSDPGEYKEKPWEWDREQLYSSTVVSKDNPAYNELLSKGLIDEEGVRQFTTQQAVIEYPYIVSPSGQRINYVFEGEPDSTPALDFYTEDRRELRHISHGELSVHEEIDGYTADENRDVYIEDIHGTIVGNQTTPNEISQYKRLLTLKLFNSKYSNELNAGPQLSRVMSRGQEATAESLARLYRIKSPIPDSTNEYIFGVTKEGKVLLHVPSTKNAAKSEENGISVEANLEGLLKSIIGRDAATGLSAHVTTLGGVNLNIGQAMSSSDDPSKKYSVNITSDGPVRRRMLGGSYAKNFPLEDIYIDGDKAEEIDGSYTASVSGTTRFNSGGAFIVSSESVANSAGSGGYKITSNASVDVVSSLGAVNTTSATLATSTFALGCNKVVLGGIDNTFIPSGSKLTNVTGGTITTNVATGSIVTSVGTGNYLVNVGSGSMAATVGTGSLALTVSAGAMSLESSGLLSQHSFSAMNISAPVIAIGSLFPVVTAAVVGVPGPGGPALDYLTGLPLMGIPNVLVGA